MTPFFYMIIWLLYLFSVVVALIGAWRVSRSWPFPLKALGRIALIVIFLTPAPQVDGGGWLAPAFISMIFDQMQGVDEGWFRAGIYMVISATLGLLIYLVILGRWIFRKGRQRISTD